MRKSILAAGIAAVLAGWTTLPAQAGPKVLVSILPIHSLVAGIMRGVAEPTLLVPVGASPHTYALKPSDARALQSADIVFWVGEHLENYLGKPLESLAGKARVVEVASIPNLTLLPTRKGGAFELKDDDHAAEEAEDHHDEADSKHGHEANAHDGHAHGDTDAHIWLSPANARLIAARAVRELSAADPANAARYAANGRNVDDRLTALEARIKSRLAPVKGRAYIVFHDAYQYFEHHFGTRVAGAITVSPDQAPGARRIAELQERIRTASAVCVFREPQFPAPIVDTLLRGTSAKAGVLDPEGADLTPGPDAYFTLMERIADSLADCLKPGA